MSQSKVQPVTRSKVIAWAQPNGVTTHTWTRMHNGVLWGYTLAVHTYRGTKRVVFGGKPFGVTNPSGQSTWGYNGPLHVMPVA